MNAKHLQHLYWRAGFGILPRQLQQLQNLNRREVVDNLFKDSKSVTSLQIDISEFESINPRQVLKNKKRLQDLKKKSRQRIVAYNHAWLDRLANPKETLRERMTLFWANHFVCKSKNIIHVQKYNNTLRNYALGNFGDFVKAVSKQATMIDYLNTKQNRKRKPNENFARELLELFTLGIGNYSETDIKEAARAFTGYNNNFKGEFQLRTRQHDYGLKTFFNETGNFDGDAIIDIILKEKQCAQFICEKLYGYFVNEKVNNSHVAEMVQVFYKNYNIETLMKHVFSSDWFYNRENIGSKIKSPIDFLVGVQHVIPFQFQNEKDGIRIQKLLGQVLLDPPNVAGWKTGKSWIDSNTMLLRLRLASLLMNEARIPLNEKNGFNDTFRKRFFKNRKGRKNVFETELNWKHFHDNFEAFSPEILEQNLLLCSVNNGTKNFLETLDKNDKREYCIQLMSLPEYQLC